MPVDPYQAVRRQGDRDRHLAHKLLDVLARHPVVVLVGALGVGKTTLARTLSQSTWPAKYVSLENPGSRARAREDPEGFLHRTGEPAVLDAVERAPELVAKVLARVRSHGAQAPPWPEPEVAGVAMEPPPGGPKRRGAEARGRCGRYLLTASVDFIKPVDRLVAVERLWPFSWSEWQGRGPVGLVDQLFAAPDGDDGGALRRALGPTWSHNVELRELLLRGGMPTPALADSHETLTAWFPAYREQLLTLLQATSAKPVDKPTLACVLATMGRLTGSPVVVEELARQTGTSASTARRAMKRLRGAFLFDLVEAWDPPKSRRRFSLLCDTRLASCLRAHREPMAQATTPDPLSSPPVLKTWVYGELRRDTALSQVPTEVRFARGRHNTWHVDFLLIRGPAHVGIRVTPGRASPRDAQELGYCRRAVEQAGLCWSAGVVLHGDAQAETLAADVVAVPFGVFYGSRK